MNGDDVNLDRVRVALLFDRPYVYSSPARVPQLPYFAGVQDPLPQTDASGAGSVRDLLPRSVGFPGAPPWSDLAVNASWSCVLIRPSLSRLAPIGTIEGVEPSCP